MPNYERFEDLPVWQESARLYNRILDLLQKDCPGSSTFRSQIDGAGLSVSNNIAEGFEKLTTGELITFLGTAKGSAGEVRSMVAVVFNRLEFKVFGRELATIRTLAESCSRQLRAWINSVENSQIKGKRYLTEPQKHEREAVEKAKNFGLTFLRNLKPEHPLYDSPDARAARGGQEHQ